MTFLDICAGIGGISLGLEWAGMKCKGQVEIDEWCRKILTKHWPEVPKWEDVKKLDYNCLPSVDLVAGGYPCQPFSLAGNRKGKEDDRHIWPNISQIVSYLRPAWCLFENVAGHISMGLDEVLSDLESKGYTTATLFIPACGIGAPHVRRRVWILAYTNRPGCKERYTATFAERKRFHPRRTSQTGSFWETEPAVGRVANGIPRRVDRLRGLGNAVVPQVVQVIGEAIMSAEEES